MGTRRAVRGRGQRLIRLEEAVEEIAAAAGRPLRFTPVPAAAYSDVLRSEGVPGREPTDFRHYVTETAATGVAGARASGTA